ncbi:MAG: PadR family transcriptional regulator [Huintestinicola sp.]
MDKGQMKKGVLEMCILHICNENDMYGYEIMKRVTDAFPEINESTIYAVLRRLNADGSTESYTGTVSGGPQRKYYRITDSGRKQLAEMTEMWKDTINAVYKIGIK